MMRAALALLLAVLPAAAQTADFSDADFGFTIKLPPGLTPVDEAGRTLILGGAAQARNVPRAEADGKPITHHHYWVDQSTPYNRQAALFLLDSPPPYNPGKPEDFLKAMGDEGLKIESHELIPPPVFGLRVEGTFQRQPDNATMRKVVLYVPDLFGKRYGLLTLQAFDADWAIVKPEFEATLASVRMQRADPPQEVIDAAQQKAAAAQAARGEIPQPGGTPPHPGPGPGPGKGGRQAATAKTAPDPPGDWGSLPVAGSFVLSALVLGHLLLSGRGR